jgi:WD40 repeat protein
MGSPDGRFLGYVKEGVLHIRGSDGADVATVENIGQKDKYGDWYVWDWRFSADSKKVAAVVRMGDEDPEIVVVYLETGEQRELGSVHGGNRIEWTSEGIVTVQFVEKRAQLVYLPLEGERRTLMRPQHDVAGLFVAAPEGTLVYYARKYEEGYRRLFRVDVASDADPQPVATLKETDWVQNVDITRDGSRVAYAAGHRLLLYDNETGKLRKLGGEKKDNYIQTVWFSHDGARLLYASAERVTVVQGKEAWTYDAADEDKVAGVRFAPGSNDVLVATRKKLVRWHPDAKTKAKEKLAASKRWEPFVLADTFGEDLIVWGSAPPDSAREFLEEEDAK